MNELRDIYSHNSLRPPHTRERSLEIARSAPLKVKTYEELAEKAAEISYRNREYFPLYRGQAKDYQSSKGRPRSSLIGNFHRPGEGKQFLTGPEKTKRRERLEAAAKAFVRVIKEKAFPYRDDFIKDDFQFTDELVWSILQHYEILPTPLLDLTQSLSVACSFASLDRGGGNACVYMLGFEGISPNIFYSYRERYQLIRLSSVMPKIAKRPFYQEGYFLGDFPQGRCFEEQRTNFACRLLAKFSFDPKTFWTSGMKALPRSVLYPRKDEMEQIMKRIEISS